MKCMFDVELNYIKNQKIKKNAEILINLLPKYFFEIPASSTGKYHPKFSLGESGLVRHTKVAVRIAKELLDNNSIGYVFTSDEKDLIITALLIHDGIKSGFEKQKYGVFEHPLLIGKLIKDNKEKLDLNEKELQLLIHMVECHMGEFNTNAYSQYILPKPDDKYSKFVHMCDFLSSKKFLDVKFKDNEIVEE